MTHNMQHTILYSLLSILLLSCHLPNAGTRLIVLQRADSLMQEHPDSALYLLENIESVSVISQEDKAYYALLLTQARDKNYILHTADSLIKTATKYYDLKAENDGLRIKSHYYLARVYQDMDSVSAAVQEFMIAKQWAEEKEDSNFIYLASANLGYLLKEYDLLNEADAFYRRAEEIAVLNNDSLRLAITLINQANIYIMRGEKYHSEAKKYNLKAEKKLLNALKITRGAFDLWTERSVVRSLGGLYSNMERYEDVIYWERYYLSIQPDSIKRFSAYLNLGNAFYQLEKLDSSFYYLSQSLLSSNYYIKSDSYKILSNIMVQKGCLAESLHWKDSCLVYTNLSLSTSRPVEIVNSLKNIVNQQSINRYKHVMKKQWVIIVGMMFFSLIILFYSFWKHKKSRIQLSCLKKEVLVGKEWIEHKEKEITCLQDLIAECQNDKVKVAILRKQLNDICAEKDKLFGQIVHDLPTCKILISLLENNKKTDVPKSLIENKLWKEIIIEIDSIASGFSMRLMSTYPLLKTNDIYFCCLLKMGFKFSDIACLCGRTSSMMYKRRNIIADRIGLNDALALEAFIKSF